MELTVILTSFAVCPTCLIEYAMRPPLQSYHQAGVRAAQPGQGAPPIRLLLLLTILGSVQSFVLPYLRRIAFNDIGILVSRPTDLRLGTLRLARFLDVIETGSDIGILAVTS